MNRLLSPDQAVELLGQLRAGLEVYGAGTRDLEQETQRDIVRLERQHKQARQQLEEYRATALDEANASHETSRARLEARTRRRRDWIARASASLRDDRQKSISGNEARRVFQIQRGLLEATRERDARLQQSDAHHAAFLEQWQLAGDQLLDIELRAHGAFRGYGGLRRRLRDGPADLALPELPPDADQQLQFLRSLSHEAGEALDRFKRLLLPRMFSLAPLWLLLVLAVVVTTTAVPLLPMIGGPSIRWSQAGLVCAALVVVALALYFWGRHRASPAAETVIRLVHQARSVHHAAETTAVAAHQHALTQARQECDNVTASLEHDWNATIETAAADSARIKETIETRINRASSSLDRQRAQSLARLESERASRLDQLGADTDARLAALEVEHNAKRREIESRHQSRKAQLDAELQGIAGPIYAKLEAARQSAQDLFPPWTEPEWESWKPPAEFLSGAPLGDLEIDVAQLTGASNPDVLSRLPGPARFEVPLLLTFPRQGSVWFETRDHGRELAVGALNNLVMRLLAGAPPGRISFTILDPVGLGQNFAGLMHLADHAERLINRRIWTQPEQIEQQLADLNEHIEKVTQLYLRNEYESIAEYNQQAGRVAEPYHFLVIADFPAGFSDLAARRLLSIVSSGPRCGVFTLVHWDRRRPAPADFPQDDLRKTGVRLEARGQTFGLAGPVPPGVAVRLDSPPDAALTTTLLQNIGRCSIDAYRVELPFAQIAPGPEARWTLDTVVEVRVPIGITGATKLQYLALGKGTRQHALIAGKTGSGKSTLFHVIVTNLALWARPDQVEFYLVDFKKGVEFKCYATHRLPHARVVAIESDREFALSVLQRLDDELRRRGDLFRQRGVQDLPGYQRDGGSDRLPRVLLIIDEFQEFFTEDDRVAQNAALLLDRLVRQGRAFGIHVLLGSQTLGGAYTLARTTLGQMTIRVALQCNQADALLIMDDDNAAPRLLSRPGEAIYNDAAGAVEGNHPFQVAWLADDERDEQLRIIRQHADQFAPEAPAPVVFEGNAPANVRENAALSALLAAPALQQLTPPRIWLGAPNSIKGPTEAQLRRQSGNNLLIIGLYEESMLALFGVSLVSLAAQHRRDAARFVLFDASAPDSSHREFLERLTGSLPQRTDLLGPAELNRTLTDLTAELEQRAGSDTAGPAIYLFIHHVPRFKGLRYEDDFSVSLESTGSNPAQQLNRLLTEGPPLGIHVLCTCDTFNNATRFFGRRALSEFELRVLFQMSAADSASLIDSPQAAALGLHRALLYNAQQGTLETFRPYALPGHDWIEEAGRELARLSG